MRIYLRYEDEDTIDRLRIVVTRRVKDGRPRIYIFPVLLGNAEAIVPPLSLGK